MQITQKHRLLNITEAMIA